MGGPGSSPSVVKLLFLLLLSVRVGSGEDRRWMDLLQTGVGSGVFGGAGSGAPSVRLGFLFTLCVRWGGLCTPCALSGLAAAVLCLPLGACLPRRDSFRRRRIPLSCRVAWVSPWRADADLLLGCCCSLVVASAAVRRGGGRFWLLRR